MFIATMTCPTKHRDQEGRSALSLALESGDVLMKVLIERGADVNTQDKVVVSRSLHYT